MKPNSFSIGVITSNFFLKRFERSQRQAALAAKRRIRVAQILDLAVLCMLVLGLFARPIPALAATYTVNSTDDVDDGACNAAHCSLREAINTANTSAGMDEILFDSLPVGSIIVLTDPLPIITDAQTTLRGDLHPGYSGTPVIGIDGYGAGDPSIDFVGLITIESSSSDVRGLAIFGYSIGPAILVRGASVATCTIRDNFIGTDLTGTTAIPNGHGISVEQATGTVIQDNLISGNWSAGILLAGGGVSGTIIQGNKIGTDFSGAVALPNRNGIVLIPADAASLGPSGNTIGGATPSDGNIISASVETGIILDKASLNILENNSIGADAAGVADLGNALAGIYIKDNSNENSVLNNTISGNNYVGIYLLGADNTIQGNRIGTDATGSAALGNFGGILVESTYGGNLIGGPAAGQGNLISGNTGTGGSLGLSGVRIFGASTNPNIIQGNLIGTDLGGASAIPNAASGIELMNDANNQVLDNVISGNGLHGVQLYNSTGALIQGNKIGTDMSGVTALGNGFSGINIHPAGAQNVTIGGAGSGQDNVISGNGAEGIYLTGSDHVVQGNTIGTDITGTAAIPNGGPGILLQPSTMTAWPLENILIGGSDPSAGNIISGNSGYGIEFGGGDGYATGTIIQNNQIGSDASGSGALPNGEGGIRIFGSNTLVGGVNAGNVIAHNSGAGIDIYGPNSSFAFSVGNTLSRNSIFQNDGLGIDLGENGITTNDAGDGDSGANTFLNYPEFTLVTSTVVEGTACDGCLVEVFLVDEDPTGYGEGASFLADGLAGGGLFSIDISSASLGLCDSITGTVTDPDGNTSEFSPNQAPGTCQAAGSAIILVLSFIPGIVFGAWVFRRRRSALWAAGAFVVGTVVTGVVMILGIVTVGTIRMTSRALPTERATRVTVQGLTPSDPVFLTITPEPLNQETPFTLTPTTIQLPSMTPTATLPPVTIPPEPPTSTLTPKPPQDNEGPGIKSVSDAPDPIYASAPKGCKPTASTISAAINDPSGVASAIVIYIGTSAGSVNMNNTGGNQWQAQLGSFDAPGAVNYQIRAFDSLGNRSDTNFSTLTVNACIP